MKLFDYKCPKCEKTKEERVKSLEQVVICEECEEAMTRLFPAPAFHLKGGGWYKDGYSGGGK